MNKKKYQNYFVFEYFFYIFAMYSNAYKAQEVSAYWLTSLNFYINYERARKRKIEKDI